MLQGSPRPATVAHVRAAVDNLPSVPFLYRLSVSHPVLSGLAAATLAATELGSDWSFSCEAGRHVREIRATQLHTILTGARRACGRAAFPDLVRRATIPTLVI